MTVSSLVSAVTFDCDGSSVNFACPFRVLDSTEVVCYLITESTGVATELTNGVDFTVTNVGEPNAVVTTATAYSTAYQLRAVRETQRVQPTDYREGDPLPAESHERALDRLTHIVQEIDSALSRAFVAPEPETGVTLPAAADRANKMLGFGSGGAPVVSTITLAQMEAAVFSFVNATGNNAASILYSPGYSGSVSRATSTRLQDRISVLDFGGDATGAGDSSAAFTAAAATGRIVWRPKGSYLRGAATRTYSTDGFEGVLWIGNGIINNSDDPQLVVSRDVDDTGSGNAHSFSDSSVYTRTGDISHNSYDDRTKTVAAGATAHHASYQVGTEFAISGGGTFGNLFSFVTAPTISAGTLTNYYGLLVNAPTVTGSGAVTNCYGVYFPLGYGKGGSGFNPATGVVLAINNESQAMVYSRGPVQGQDGLIAGNGAGTSYVNVKTIDAVTNAGTLAGLRLSQTGTQRLDIEIPASQTHATVSNAAGVIMKLNADRSIVYTMPTTMPTLANGEGAFAQTSDVNLRYSYRGSDGTLRSINWTIA